MSRGAWRYDPQYLIAGLLGGYVGGFSIYVLIRRERGSRYDCSVTLVYSAESYFFGFPIMWRVGVGYAVEEVTGCVGVADRKGRW